jgi:hypothetical protein
MSQVVSMAFEKIYKPSQNFSKLRRVDNRGSLPSLPSLQGYSRVAGKKMVYNSRNSRQIPGKNDGFQDFRLNYGSWQNHIRIIKW